MNKQKIEEVQEQIAKTPSFVIDLVGKVKALAAASPGFVYHAPLGGACSYGEYKRFGDTYPGCIVGQAAKSLGFDLSCADPIDVLPDGSIVHGEPFSDNSISGIVNGSALELTPRDKYALQWLRDVQGRQDMQKTWGEAVKGANERLLKSILD